jgi:hypothetical protein
VFHENINQTAPRAEIRLSFLGNAYDPTFVTSLNGDRYYKTTAVATAPNAKYNQRRSL